MQRVLVADALAEAGVAALEEHFEVDVITGLDKPDLLEVIGQFDAVVVRSATTIDADVIAAADKLQVIARAGIGLDNVDVEAATARGVLVCNAPQSNVISAAEHTIALLLALARHIAPAHAGLVAGRWDRSSYQGVELHGKTVGIVGLGRVGALVAQRLSAFGVTLVGYDPYVTAERAEQLGVELIPSVSALCSVADIVTVHLPKTSATTGIIGTDELRGMKPSALLVNTARGGIVDEAALHTALEERWIAGAALDVFETEPVTDSPLFALDNVVVTPHLGASTADAQDKAGTMVAESVRLALAGDYVPSAVNVQVSAAIPTRVKPFMPLAETLGRMFTGLHREPASAELTVEFHGSLAEEDTQILTLSVLRGLLEDVSSDPVTYVNAPLVAEERGLKLSTLSSSASKDFVASIRVAAGEVAVAGTLIGPAARPRLVEAWGFDVDMEPADHMVFFRYTDRPGIVGAIGARLGEADVNIGAMQVARHGAGGEALVTMTVDESIDAATLADIASLIGAGEVRQVDLAGG